MRWLLGEARREGGKEVRREGQKEAHLAEQKGVVEHPKARVGDHHRWKAMGVARAAMKAEAHPTRHQQRAVGDWATALEGDWVWRGEGAWGRVVGQAGVGRQSSLAELSFQLWARCAMEEGQDTRGAHLAHYRALLPSLGSWWRCGEWEAAEARRRLLLALEAVR
jgi:hypothetical protein